MTKEAWLMFDSQAPQSSSDWRFKSRGVDLGGSLSNVGESWEDGGGRAQKEVDEIDKTEEGGQASGDSGDVAGQGDKAALCNNVIRILLFFCVQLYRDSYLRPKAWIRSTIGAARVRI